MIPGIVAGGMRRASSGGGVIVPFSNVTLLAHYDANFADFSSSQATVATSGATISSAQSKFGGGSATNSSASGQVLYSKSGAFNWASNTDAFFEFYIYAPVGASIPTNYSFAHDGANYVTLSVVGSNLYGNGNGTFLGLGIIGQLGQWHHVLIGRTSSNQKRIFVNGILVDNRSATSVTTSQFGVFGIPGRSDLPSLQNVFVDELRWVQGVAPPSANFNPPTAPFPNS